MIRAAHIVPTLLLAVLAAVFGAYLWQIGPGGKDISRIPSPMIEKPAPALALPPIAGLGQGLETADLMGRVSLVNFWASWCPPCRVEHPVLMTLAEEGVPVMGVNVKDKPADALAFLDELGNPYSRIGADANGRAAIDWGVSGYPETFVVDAEGRIRHRHVGPINPGELDRIIRPALARAGDR